MESNKTKYLFYVYMRLLDLYDFLEVYPDDIDATLEVKALEVIYRIHDEEIEALGGISPGGVSNG